MNRIHWGTVLGAAFLALQAGLVIRAQFVESRDFCWSPHTTQVRYALDVVIRGEHLTETQVAARYGLRQYGWEAHAPRNLIDLIAQCERTYGRSDGARVVLRYQVNGGAYQRWEWPSP